VVIALGSVLAPPPGLVGREHLIGYKFAGEFNEAHAHLAGLLGGAELLGRRRSTRTARRRASRRLVVIGGGISGVELAGELAHLAVKRPAGWHAPR
jgi:NADH dehydrogenase